MISLNNDAAMQRSAVQCSAVQLVLVYARPPDALGGANRGMWEGESSVVVMVSHKAAWHWLGG